MLDLCHITLHRSGRPILENIDLRLHAGQKCGLIGANGSGKSSLFALILGELEADDGTLALPAEWVVAHVRQENPSGERRAIDYVMDGDTELRRVERLLAEAERRQDGEEVARLHTHLERIDGYRAHARAARLLHGLGFAPETRERPLDHFSGGWRMRLNLARALMCRSDLLLLDEPTNHLDLDAVLWLEGWLEHYPGTLLLISHDRDFLDRTVHHIAHLERGMLRLYPGNYSDFEVQRAEALSQQQAAWEKQQRSVAHMRRFVDRFRAKATKARQAQSRLKALARMEVIAAAHADTPFDFRFATPERLPSPLLTLEEAAAGYGTQPVVAGVEMTLLPDQRLGLLGPNGAGKSTLLRLMAGVLPPLAGRRQEGNDLRIGYFAQHQIEQLHPEDSPLAHLQRQAPDASEQSLRDFLGGFGFPGDTALAPVAPLSGGEKSRLVLALLVHSRPALLLLDEPTNHLDLEMRHALTVALQQFSGAVVLIAHDRHLLNATCDHFWLVADGRAEPFTGDLEEYATWLRRRRGGGQEEQEAERATPVPDRQQRRREAAEQRQRLKPLRDELARLETALARLTQKQQVLEETLADPSLYTDAANKPRLKALLLEKAELESAMAETEEAWLTVGEELEAAGATA